MRLASRLFVESGLIVLATVAGLIAGVDGILRRGLTDGIARELEHEARLVGALLPADSTAWAGAARHLGVLTGKRLTLIDATGRVRGDTDFEPLALPRLENHLSRPEVAAALRDGAGRDQRVSASTFAPQLYVAVRGGPPGLAVVRASSGLAAVGAQVWAVQRAVLGAGALALLLAALVAWLRARALARPLVRLSDAARDIAAGRPAAFPESRVPEVARHIHALRAMHEELAERFGALRREREETATVLDAMSDGVLAANVRGDVVSCNSAARRLLGFRDDAAMPPLGELFHDKPAREILRRLLAGSGVEQEPLELDDRHLLVTGRALPDGGTLLVLRDVTALRRLEMVRSDFVANVSHELKTPLTSIVGYAETLAAEAPPDAPTHRFAGTILASARRMQRLVDDLLDLSRIESGGWRPQPEVVEVEPAARDAWTPFADRARAAGVTFEVTVPADAHALAADPDALRQILVNLYDNALRYTPRGGRIRVTAERAPSGMSLTVSDTGTGIASDHLPRIFERFYRVDPGRSREQGGTGLGLAIVKHLVDAHNGQVDAESRLGQGTAIRMTFPGT